MPRVRVLLLVVLGLVACSTNHHIKVPPLPPQPTPQQRLDIWQHWHSRAAQTERVTTCSRVSCDTREHAIVVLEGGVEVRHVEDLLPIVAPDSTSARAAHEVLRLRDKRPKYNWIMGLGALVGTGVTITGAKEDSMAIAFSGVGIIAVTAIVGVVAKHFIDKDIDAATNRGLDAYNDSLAARLNVCVQGYAIVPCEAPGTISVPLVDPDPALQGLPQR